jgi:hypothetical protein
MDPAPLSLVMERQAEDIHEPEFAAYTPLVAFEAFLAAQRLFGWVRLDADRLTDLLNAHDVLRLANVHVQEHRDGSTVSADETFIPRSEIFAVVASGMRGDPAQRVATESTTVVISAGGYRIGGDVHFPHGVDPAERFRSGGPMVPLTDAWLEYRSGGLDRCVGKETIIVNRASVSGLEFLTA